MRILRRPTVALVVVALGVGFVGCGDDESATLTGPDGEQLGDPGEVGNALDAMEELAQRYRADDLTDEQYLEMGEEIFRSTGAPEETVELQPAANAAKSSWKRG